MSQEEYTISLPLLQCRSKKCGAILPERAVYCPFCGLKQEQGTKTPRRRGNGQGSVYRRGTTWTAQITVGWRLKNGKASAVKKTKSGFATKKAALEYLPQLRAPQERRETTLASLYDGWQPALRKLSASKQTAFEIAWKRLKSIEYVPIQALTIDRLQKVVDDTTGSYYTARDVKTLLSHLYKRAMAQQDVTQNLASFITLPDLEESEQIPFTEAEIRLLWAAYKAGETFAGYILLMIYTGMMPGELLSLKKDMIQWDTQQIVGAGKKTKKRKTTPLVIPDFFIPVLRDLCQSEGEKVVRMNRDNFYRRYHEVVTEAGCRDLPPYSCRHTTATALALGNIAPSVIQEVMRHTKFSTTERYIHVNTEQSLDAVNRVFTT